MGAAGQNGTEGQEEMKPSCLMHGPGVENKKKEGGPGFPPEGKVIILEVKELKSREPQTGERPRAVYPTSWNLRCDSDLCYTKRGEY